MSVFLLLLGVVTTAAGLALVVSGVTIHDGAFDTDVVTPGTIAAVGGLLLVGMGLAVRELRRIERALAARPPPLPVRLGEAAVAAEALDSAERPPPLPVRLGEAAVAVEAPDPGERVSFAPKPTIGAPAQSVLSGATAAAPPSDHGAIEGPQAKFPTVDRRDNGPVVETPDVPLMQAAPVSAEEDVGGVKDTRTVGRAGNGAAPARALPRLEAKVRPSVSSSRTQGVLLNAFWPARPPRDGHSVPIAAPSAPTQSAPPLADEAVPHPGAAAVGEPATAAVFVLKSGVVEGMAYSLFSDGSIEAQLPQGTFRFGSLTALRNHIENSL